METTVLTTTCILIATGVLIKRFPMLLGGYNTLPKHERLYVDIKGLSTFMCYSLVGMGIAPLLVFYICLGIGHADWAGLSILIPLAYIPFLIYKANSYDHNKHKRSRKYVVFISMAMIVVVGLFMFYGISPTSIRINQNQLTFTGMFGTTRSIDSFTGVKLTDSLPQISRRLNGLSVGGINKGRFQLNSGGSCLMYLSSNDSPYIVFVEKSGREIFYNSRNSEMTYEMFRELLSLFPSK